MRRDAGQPAPAAPAVNTNGTGQQVAGALLLLAVAALGPSLPAHAEDAPPHSFVEYQGQRIPTTGAYRACREYQNDPANPSPAGAGGTLI